jgi:hypothetical protein
MKTFTIDARNVMSFDDFIVAVNVGFLQHVNGEWNGNLDAFNDYLCWPGEKEYRLELLGAEGCAQTLGHAAQATWLKGHLATCHPSSVPGMQAKLLQAEAGEGQTLFDVVLEIIGYYPHVHLVLL